MTNEELFEQNINLANKMVWQYKNCGVSFEDLQQLCYLGLWKAIISFDHKHTLSTYAWPVMSNEINQYLRKNRKHFNNMSLSEPVGENMEMEQFIADEKDNIQRLENKIDIENQLKKIEDSSLDDDTKKIFNLYISGCKQSEIAKKMKCSQPQVSRKLKKIIDVDKYVKKENKVMENKNTQIKEEHKNKLIDLNDILFQELKNLMDDSLTQEQLDQEIKVSKQVVSVSQTIINNANLLLQAKKHFDTTENKNSEIAPLLRLQ